MPDFSARSLLFSGDKTNGKHHKIKVLIPEVGAVQPVPEPDSAAVLGSPKTETLLQLNWTRRRVFALS